MHEMLRGLRAARLFNVFLLLFSGAEEVILSSSFFFWLVPGCCVHTHTTIPLIQTNASSIKAIDSKLLEEEGGGGGWFFPREPRCCRPWGSLAQDIVLSHVPSCMEIR